MIETKMPCEKRIAQLEEALRWYADDLNCTDPEIARLALAWPLKTPDRTSSEQK